MITDTAPSTLTGNFRVLILDNDEVVLNRYRRMLESATVAEGSASPREAPFEVTTGTRGEDGVEMVRRRLENNTPFAVVFVVLLMPPGIDGLETARRIRELDRRTHLVIMTDQSAPEEADITRLQSDLRYDFIFIQKPMEKGEVVQLAYNACTSWKRNLRNRTDKQKLESQMAHLGFLNNYFQEILYAINEGIILCSAGGAIQFINPAATQLFGRDVGALLKRSVVELFRGDILALVRGIVEANNKPDHVKWDLRLPDGSRRHVLLSGSVITDANGEVKSVLLVLNDLTKWRRPAEEPRWSE